MAEFKEAKGPFEAHERDIVQEWLAHPCTVEVIEQLDDAVKNSKETLVQFAINVGVAECPEYVIAQTHRAGSIIATFASIRDLLKEAQRYANS